MEMEIGKSSVVLCLSGRREGATPVLTQPAGGGPPLSLLVLRPGDSREGPRDPKAVRICLRSLEADQHGKGAK